MKTFLLILTCFLAANCVTRDQVNAVIWLNNFSSEEMKALCKENPILHLHGFYRKLDNGTNEIIPICTKTAGEMLSATPKDYNEILDKALPRPNDLAK